MKKLKEKIPLKYKRLYRKIYWYLWRLYHKNNLRKLAQLYNPGKLSWYFEIYNRHLKEIRSPGKLLEIGVGGYNDLNTGGGSLRMWATYFRKSTIYGIDVVDKSLQNSGRIKTFIIDQSKKRELEDFAKEHGPFDIIIDDGSHFSSHVICSFQVLFKHLNDGGIYIIEDTQTSYWDDWGGCKNNFNVKTTTMGFFKSLVDGLNYEEFDFDSYHPTYYDKNIFGISFYHNMIIINKDENNYGSNIKGKRW